MAMNGTASDVVIGTGPLGLAVVRELSRRGKVLRAVNRSGRADVPAGVQVVPGDITDATFGREVARAEAARMRADTAKPDAGASASQVRLTSGSTTVRPKMP